MNFRAVIAFAVLLLVVANAALLVRGNIPGCTKYRVVYEPVLCAPDQPTVNCDVNAKTYTTKKQWLIQTKFNGEYIASYEGQLLPKPGLHTVYPDEFDPVFYWENKEEDVIVKTGAVCGGRYMSRFPGYFGTQKTQDPESYAIQQLDALAECSEEYDCYWDTCSITGFLETEVDPLGGGEKYMAFFAGIYTIHYCATKLVSASPALRITWRDAYWGECDEGH